MFPTSARLGVAVSGGADSTFLLHALHELAPRWNLRLSVVHIDHGIRGAASSEDAAHVRQLAAAFNLPFHLHTADVPAIPDNLEQAARHTRHEFFAHLIKAGTHDRIATGHTRADQAETVLYRILRGSGLQGLAGILPVTTEGLVRPLLEFDRAEIEAWLRERNISWREDATNQDPAYTRNRLRHEILPLLRDAFNPNIDAALSTLATLAQDEESYWNSILPKSLGAEGQPIILSAKELTGPPALARRLVRRAIELTKGDLRQIDFAHVERILTMARSVEGHDRIQLPGLDIFRSFEWIRIAPPAPQTPRDFSLPLHPPASVELPDGSARIVLQVLEKTGPSPRCATLKDVLDWERLNGENALSALEVRNWRPGDQYQRVGTASPQKVKILFQDARIPLWERRGWPIITYNGVIVWVRRFGPAAQFAAGAGARVLLQIGEQFPGKLVSFGQTVTSNMTEPTSQRSPQGEA